MTQFVTLKLFTHYADGEADPTTGGDIGTTLHTLHEVPREALYPIVERFDKCPYTGVHKDTLALLTDEERAALTAGEVKQQKGGPSGRSGPTR